MPSFELPRQALLETARTRTSAEVVFLADVPSLCAWCRTVAKEATRSPTRLLRSSTRFIAVMPSLWQIVPFCRTVAGGASRICRRRTWCAILLSQSLSPATCLQASGSATRKVRVRTLRSPPKYFFPHETSQVGGKASRQGAEAIKGESLEQGDHIFFSSREILLHHAGPCRFAKTVFRAACKVPGLLAKLPGCCKTVSAGVVYLAGRQMEERGGASCQPPSLWLRPSDAFADALFADLGFFLGSICIKPLPYILCTCRRMNATNSKVRSHFG